MYACVYIYIYMDCVSVVRIYNNIVDPCSHISLMHLMHSLLQVEWIDFIPKTQFGSYTFGSQVLNEGIQNGIFTNSKKKIQIPYKVEPASSTTFNLYPGVKGHVFYVLHVNHRFSGKRAVLAFVDLAAPIAVRQHLRKTVVVWMERIGRVDMSHTCVVHSDTRLQILLTCFCLSLCTQLSTVYCYKLITM